MFGGVPLVFNYDGQYFAGAGDKGITVVDIGLGAQSAWIATEGAVRTVAFSADGLRS